MSDPTSVLSSYGVHRELSTCHRLVHVQRGSDRKISLTVFNNINVTGQMGTGADLTADEARHVAKLLLEAAGVEA